VAHQNWLPEGARLRILIAHSFYRQPGGEDRYVSDQARFLSEAGHAVHVLRRENTDLEPSGRAALRMAYSRSLVNEVRDELRIFRPDLVHLHNPYPSFGPAVHLAADRESVPLVQSVHNLRLRCPNGVMFTEGAVCHRCEAGLYFNAALHRCFPTRRQGAVYGANLWTHRFILKLDRKISLFVAPSRFFARRLLQWGIPESRVRHVPYMTQIPPQPPAFPSDGQGFFLGRLSPEKGLDILLHALHAAGDPPFTIAGDGHLGDDLQLLASRLDLRQTRFVGRVDYEGVQRLLAESTFLVVPSVWEENSPLSVAEALAHGRPIVVSRMGGLTELAADGRGYDCETGDVSAFAEHIRQLTADPRLCREMGSKARRFAQEELSESTHLRRLEALYSTLIQGKSR
jgi:glycosyltransferase involved in cell wall biosynthesis